MNRTPELKVLITAVALAATLAGWAAFANQEEMPTTTTMPAETPALVVEGQAPALRSVSAPARPVSAPQPVTTTRSSR